MTSHQPHQIGYFCGYVPFEIISAAKQISTRLTGFPASTAFGDTYLPHNFCSFSRNSLSLACEGAFNHLDGIVLTNTDQAMERLYDCFMQQMNSKFIYMLDVPRNRDEIATRYFRDRLNDLAEALGNAFGTVVTEANLRKEIERINACRQSLMKIYRDSGSIPAKILHKAVRSFAADPSSPPDLPKCKPHDFSKCTPIVLIGGMMEDEFLLNYLEEQGVFVVHEDLCTGRRFCEVLIDPKMDDPYMALAKGYLSRTPCARMNDNVQKLEQVKACLQRTTAAGVIYVATRFNVPDSYEAVMIKEELCKKEHLPFLLIERDCSRSFSEVELNRIDAFMEMIS